MATINTAHHESGGVILYQGELILLFSENVEVSIVEKKENETGKLYLTTHRMIFTNRSMKNNLKSLSLPFYTLHDLSLEQPIFGANYIKGKATEAGNAGKFTFKLKFSHGGCTEYGQALLNAAKAVRNVAQSGGFNPPPPYTNPASQYYEAPPNVYQPAYNCGFTLPNDIFNQPPPAGFIYTSEAPPPYPGLNSNTNNPKSGYPTQPPSGFPSNPPAYGGGPAPGYPSGPSPPLGFNIGGPPPSQPSAVPGYPGHPPQPSAVPGYHGHPPQPGPYPGQQAPGGYPGQQPNGYPPQRTNDQNQQSSMYPSLNDFASAPPSAPPQ